MGGSYATQGEKIGSAMDRLNGLLAAAIFVVVNVVLFSGVITMVGDFGAAYEIAASESTRLAGGRPDLPAVGAVDCRKEVTPG